MGVTAVGGLGVEGGCGADDGEEGCYCCRLHGVWYRVVDKLWLIQMILNFCVGNLAKCVRLMSFEFGSIHAPLLMAFFGYSTRVCTGELVGFDPGAICRTLDWEFRFYFVGFMFAFSVIHALALFWFLHLATMTEHPHQPLNSTLL